MFDVVRHLAFGRWLSETTGGGDFQRPNPIAETSPCDPRTTTYAEERQNGTYIWHPQDVTVSLQHRAQIQPHVLFLNACPDRAEMCGRPATAEPEAGPPSSVPALEPHIVWSSRAICRKSTGTRGTKNVTRLPQQASEAPYGLIDSFLLEPAQAWIRTFVLRLSRDFSICTSLNGLVHRWASCMQEAATNGKSLMGGA